jgi:hypothetical protein
VDLIRYYESTGRVEPFKRYAEKLAGIHLSERQYIEHAFALKLHADKLAWSSNPLPEMRSVDDKQLYPAQASTKPLWQIPLRVVLDHLLTV